MSYTFSRETAESQYSVFHSYNVRSRKISAGFQKKQVKRSDFSYLPDLSQFTFNRKGDIFKYYNGEKFFVGKVGDPSLLVGKYFDDYTFLKQAYRRFQYLLSKRY